MLFCRSFLASIGMQCIFLSLAFSLTACDKSVTESSTTATDQASDTQPENAAAKSESGVDLQTPPKPENFFSAFFFGNNQASSPAVPAAVNTDTSASAPVARSISSSSAPTAAQQNVSAGSGVSTTTSAVVPSSIHVSAAVVNNAKDGAMQPEIQAANNSLPAEYKVSANEVAELQSSGLLSAEESGSLSVLSK